MPEDFSSLISNIPIYTRPDKKAGTYEEFTCQKCGNTSVRLVMNANKVFTCGSCRVEKTYNYDYYLKRLNNRHKKHQKLMNKLLTVIWDYDKVSLYIYNMEQEYGVDK